MAVSVILDVTVPLLILDQVTAQWLWLTLIAVQFAWAFSAPLAGTFIASRRTPAGTGTTRETAWRHQGRP